MIYDDKDTAGFHPPTLPTPFLRDYHGKSGLRNWVILVLSRSPRNGAEIMDEIETMSFGWWRPSPGSIYPTLESLAKEGIIKKRSDNRYELTEAGLEQFERFRRGRASSPENIEEMITNMEGYLSYMEEQGKGAVEPYTESLKKIVDRIEKILGE